MINWELIAHSQHQKELMQQAHQDQMAMDILRERRGYHPTMAWLGERMMHLGSRLIEMAGREERDSNHFSMN
jgi:hypothetical protein